MLLFRLFGEHYVGHREAGHYHAPVHKPVYAFYFAFRRVLPDCELAAVVELGFFFVIFRHHEFIPAEFAAQVFVVEILESVYNRF